MASSVAEPDERIQVGSLVGKQGGTEISPAPVNLRRLAGMDLSARYHSDRWGGDFFDAVAADVRVVFLLTDIAGTRSEAHSIAAEMQIVFRQKAADLFGPPQANESLALASLAHEVNRSLLEASDGIRYAPTFLGCFNRELGILTYCNAGRMLAVFRDARSVQVLDRGGVPLGLFTHVTYEPAVLAFEPHDRLLLVTKGVTESRRGGSEFGAKRIERILEQSKDDAASRLCDTVLREAYEYGSHPWSRLYDFFHARRQHSHDDLTAVALVRSDPAAL